MFGWRGMVEGVARTVSCWMRHHHPVLEALQGQVWPVRGCGACVSSWWPVGGLSLWLLLCIPEGPGAVIVPGCAAEQLQVFAGGSWRMVAEGRIGPTVTMRLACLIGKVESLPACNICDILLSGPSLWVSLIPHCRPEIHCHPLCSSWDRAAALSSRVCVTAVRVEESRMERPESLLPVTVLYVFS